MHIGGEEKNANKNFEYYAYKFHYKENMFVEHLKVTCGTQQCEHHCSRGPTCFKTSVVRGIALRY
jgi:hypothetical protein